MTRLALIASLLLLSAPARAAEKSIGIGIGSFDRVRVDGAFDVRVVTGGSPGATVSGDPALVERVAVRVEGGVLSVRLGAGVWNERPGAGEPVVVLLTTPALSGVSASAGARVRVSRMAARRVAVSVTGAGSIAVEQIEADDAVAMLIGTGTMTLAGNAARARLMTNGPGSIDATALRAGELTLRLDGPGETLAQARYTAAITSTGLGRVDVAGSPKCTVRAAAGGPVRCGLPQP